MSQWQPFGATAGAPNVRAGSPALTKNAPGFELYFKGDRCCANNTRQAAVCTGSSRRAVVVLSQAPPWRRPMAAPPSSCRWGSSCRSVSAFVLAANTDNPVLFSTLKPECVPKIVDEFVEWSESDPSGRV